MVDAAHVLPFDTAVALNRRVVAWDNATGHQLAVATVPSLQGRNIATYGYQLGRAWRLGRKGVDDGILLLIAPTERKVRIDVGRGLEGDLTDAETSVILSETVVPKLKAGDLGAAASDGADAIMAAVPADAGDVANAPVPSRGGWWWLLAVLAALIVAPGAAIAIWWRRRHREFAAHFARVDRDIARARLAIDRGARPAGPRFNLRSPPAPAGRGASPRSTTIVAPVIVETPPYSPPSPSYAPDTSSSWGSSDSGSSSSSDCGSSSGFDSGGGSFSGGGSDSSW